MSGEVYEVGRFRRAWQLVKTGRVAPRGPRQFEVAGNDEPSYFVALDGDPPCYCMDRYHGGSRKCKHEISALIVAQDPAFLSAVATMFFATLEEESE